jgi:hypothetical protein
MATKPVSCEIERRAHIRKPFPVMPNQQKNQSQEIKYKKLITSFDQK